MFAIRGELMKHHSTSPDGEPSSEREEHVPMAVSERDRLESVEFADALFRVHFDKAPIGMTLLSAEGGYLRANRAFCRMVGYDEKELQRLSEPEVTHPDDPFHDFAEVRALAVVEEDPIQFDKRYIRRDGEAVWAQVSLSSLDDASSAGLYFIAMIQDITERKRTEDDLGRRIVELQALATTDPLTGIYNHRFMLDFLDHRLAEAKRTERPVSILMLDVDHFRRFNERHGHDVGDRALRSVAQCMRQVLREEDAACRYGGEEFAIVLSRANLPAALAVAERVRRRVEEAPPLTPGGDRLTCSIGVSTYPDHASTALSLLKAADVALYQAKHAGRNQVCEYLPGALSPQTDQEGLHGGLLATSLEAVQALITAIDLRDRYTGAHCQRVGRLAQELGVRLGVSDADLEVLRLGGSLLDVGKIGLPDHLLTKADQLTEEEWSQVRQHPVWSEQLLRQAGMPPEVQHLVRWHHERLDGSGYPDQMRGDELPMAVRIASVADVVTALKDDRPYRPAWTRPQVLAYLRQQDGKQLDAGVVQAYCDLYGDG